MVEVLNDLLSRLPSGRESLGLEVHVFSDFQSSNCDTSQLESVGAELAEREILVFLNHVRPLVAANAGISKASFYPPAILGDGEFQANTHIRASADYSGGNTLRLSINSQEQARHVFRLLPDQALSVSLGGKAGGEEGSVLGKLELDTDGFAADNTYRFSLPRLPGIPVLLVDGSARGEGSGRETFFLRYAIQPRGKARTVFLPKSMDWQTFVASDVGDFNVLYVCNPPSFGEAAVTRLETFVRNGGTAVMMPGQHDTLQKQLPLLGPLKGLRVRKENLPEGKSLAIVSSQTPSELEKKLLAIMPPPAALVVRRRLRFSELPGNASRVFQYSDGAAFMFEAPFGQGSFWVLSVSGNRDWSEWPLTPFFVVMQQELIKSSARRSLTGLTTNVGGVVAMEWTEDATELDFRMRNPLGRERMVTVNRADTDKPVILSGFDEPGFYHLERGGKKRAIAVNIPGEESNLGYLREDELGQSLRPASVYQADTWHKHQQNLVNLHHGRPLWPFLLCLAFFFAVTEEIFANLRSRSAGFPDVLRQFMRRGARAA